jgi:Asp-tRNA(Asn)/Glu-tRNA(Gln) amidotransferase A subunit family amidase
MISYTYTLEDLKKAIAPGPLSGIPIGIKDIINLIDTANSR